MPPTSIKVRDFAPTWTPPNAADLDDLYGKLCGHLSHLGMERLEAKYSWPPDVIVGLILDALDDLAGQLGSAAHDTDLRALSAGHGAPTPTASRGECRPSTQVPPRRRRP